MGPRLKAQSTGHLALRRHRRDLSVAAQVLRSLTVRGRCQAILVRFISIFRSGLRAARCAILLICSTTEGRRNGIFVALNGITGSDADLRAAFYHIATAQIEGVQVFGLTGGELSIFGRLHEISWSVEAQTARTNQPSNTGVQEDLAGPNWSDLHHPVERASTRARRRASGRSWMPSSARWSTVLTR